MPFDLSDDLVRPGSPLVVAYGVGVDSTAMLVGMHARGIRPAAILFADTGDEKAATYAYIPIIRAWLARVGFPDLTIVKNPRPKSGDKSLSESLLRLGTLPALAYGRHQCSLVWKRDPQHAWLKAWGPAVSAWAEGNVVTTAIGYDAGPRDSCRQYKAEGKESPGFRNVFPLIAWGWDRERCVEEIERAGLPVPVKSSCFHCPAMKKAEIAALRMNEPELFERAIAIEDGARARGLSTIKGLGRNFSWSEIEEGAR